MGPPIEGIFFRTTLALDKLDAGGVHVFNGSLIVGRQVNLTIEAGATIAFANADDRVIITKNATIEAVGTAADPITFTSLADVEALASAATRTIWLLRQQTNGRGSPSMVKRPTMLVPMTSLPQAPPAEVLWRMILSRWPIRNRT